WRDRRGVAVAGRAEELAHTERTKRRGYRCGIETACRTDELAGTFPRRRDHRFGTETCRQSDRLASAAPGHLAGKGAGAEGVDWAEATADPHRWRRAGDGCRPEGAGRAD